VVVWQSAGQDDIKDPVHEPGKSCPSNKIQSIYCLAVTAKRRQHNNPQNLAAPARNNPPKAVVSATPTSQTELTTIPEEGIRTFQAQQGADDMDEEDDADFTASSTGSFRDFDSSSDDSASSGDRHLQVSNEEVHKNSIIIICINQMCVACINSSKSDDCTEISKGQTNTSRPHIRPCCHRSDRTSCPSRNCTHKKAPRRKH
jgi:hypothetical protein